MPEFILNRKASRLHPFYALDAFEKGYIEAMFFTNGDIGDEREDLLNDLGVERLTRAAVKSIKADCAQFQKAAAPLLALALASMSGYCEEQAGRDFWLTRQGHGAGFWGRGELSVDVGKMPDGELITGCEAEEAGAKLQGSLGDLLTVAAKAQGEVHPYVARGWIYH